MKQREIKFRALFDSGAVKKWMKSGLSDGVWTSESFACACTQLSPWLQYTGLKDKKGREIYEGDRVRLNLSWGGMVTGEVAMLDGCYTIKLDEPIKDPGGYMRSHDYVKVYVANHAIEVIGNVFENHELLNQ